MVSNVCYKVQQGTPLCDSNRVHFLPITMINEEGNRIQWDFCLFIVADCGAEAIIGYPTLENGGIIKYNPPLGYQKHLQNAAQHQSRESKAALQLKAASAAQLLHLHEHEAPVQIAQCMHSKVLAKETRTKEQQFPVSFTRIPMGMSESPSTAQQSNLLLMQGKEEGTYRTACDHRSRKVRLFRVSLLKGAHLGIEVLSHFKRGQLVPQLFCV